MVQRETIKRGITPAEIKKTVSNRKAQKTIFRRKKGRKYFVFLRKYGLITFRFPSQVHFYNEQKLKKLETLASN